MLVKIALATIRKPQRNYLKNQEIFCRWIEKAAKEKVDVVCFPELSLYMHFNKRKKVQNEKELLEPIQRTAKKGKIYVIAPTNIWVKNRLYNRAYLIDRKGRVVGFYDKCFGFYDQTLGKKYPVFKTDFGTIGIAICYDIGFEEPVRKLANKGAKIIFVPIYYVVGKRNQAQYLKCLPFARAFENKVFLAVVNIAESHPYACVVSPRKKIVEYIGQPQKEKLVLARVNLKELKNIKSFFWKRTLVKNSDLKKYKWLAERPKNIKGYY